MNLILTTYNRPDYLKTSVASLLRTRFDRDKLWIYDDYSTDYQVVNILSEIPVEELSMSKKLEVKMINNDTHYGCDLNIYNSVMSTINRLSPIDAQCALDQVNERFVFILDSDGIYNPSWLLLVKRHLSVLLSEKIGALSIFNTRNHKVLGDYGVGGQLVEKESLGGFAIAVNKEIFKKINPDRILPNQDRFCWDWQFVAIAKEMGYTLLSTKDSYAQHIGLEGEHAIGAKFPMGDSALEFNWHCEQADNFVGE